MKRRTFIQQTGIVAGAAAVAPSLVSAAGSKKDVKLVILHTNDTHSNIDPFPENHATYPGMGGVARRATMIADVRSKEEHVLLLDSGDIFQGTPYFNKFKGVLEMKVLSEMQYDAATLGNHDFDIGMEGFKAAKQHATFPFVNANYDFSKTALKDDILPHTVIRKGPLKIGLFGLGINLDGLVSAANTSGMVYNDPVAVAQEQVKQLREKDCDLIICLSHLGYDYPNDPEKISDRKLAAATDGIHLILGGHTHTFLERPVVLQNKSGRDVLVNQVGYGGLFLGRLDVFFSGDKTFRVDSTPLAIQPETKKIRS